MSDYNTKSSNNVDSLNLYLKIRDLFEPELLTILLLLTVAGFILIKLTGEIPSGADPGNWLYISHQISKQSEWFVPPYPPIIPYLLRIFEDIWGTLLGLKILGFFTLLFQGVSIYLLLKPLKSSLLTIIASLSIPLIAYNMEVIAWGGYPQLLATAFTLISLASFNNFITKPSKIKAIISAFMISLVINTNFLVSALLASSLLILLLIQNYSSKIGLRELLKFFPYFFLSLFLFTLPVVPTLISTFQQSSGLAFGAQGMQNIFSILEYVFRTNQEYWILIGLLSIISYILPSDKVTKQLKIICFSLLSSSLMLMLLLNEPRFGTFTQISIILMPMTLIGIIKNLLQKNSKQQIKIGISLTYAILIILLLVNIKNGVDHYNGATIYYQIINKDTITALDWVKNNINNNETIACASDNIHGDNAPMGWWVEGYTGIHTFVGTDPKWMNFDVEKRNAILTNLLFDTKVTISDKIKIMKTYKISYLFFDTRDNMQYNDIKNSPYFRQIYNEQINIFELK